MIGRAGSRGFPNKNIKYILNRRVFEYPLMAAKKSKLIDRIFISTDCPVISKESQKYGVEIIKRPKKLANSKALGDHAFEHGYHEIKKRLDKPMKFNIVKYFKNKDIPNLNDKSLSLYLQRQLKSVSSNNF